MLLTGWRALLTGSRITSNLAFVERIEAARAHLNDALILSKKESQSLPSLRSTILS